MDYIWADREWAESFIKKELQLTKLENEQSKLDLDPTGLIADLLRDDLADQFQKMNEPTRDLVHSLRQNTQK